MRLECLPAPVVQAMVGAFVPAVVLGASASARAAEHRPAQAGLEWQRDAGASECIERDDLERAVEHRLGRDAIQGAEPADLMVRGRIEGLAERGWRATLEVRDSSGLASGKRVLESKDESCRSLDGSLALVLALLVDVEVTVAATPTESPRLEPRQTPLQLPETRAAPWHFDVGAGVSAAVGLLPNVSAGPRVALGVRPPSLPRLLLDMSAWLPTRETQGGAGAAFWALNVGVALCPRLVRATGIDLEACLGQRISRVVSDGFGYDGVNRRQAGIAVSLEGVARARVSLYRSLTLEVGAGAAVPLERDRYTYRNADGASATLFRPAAVAGTADLSVGAAFE